jgi:hypothetical protein
MCLEVSLRILRTILVFLHISPMDLHVTKHQASAIRSCITCLLFEIQIFQFFLFSKYSFAKQNCFWTKFTTIPLKVTAKHCKQLVPLMFFNGSRIISERNCKKFCEGYDWIGNPFSFQRRLFFIVVTSNG